MHTIALKNIGLKDSEVRVYLALLGLGPAKVSDIAKKARMYNKNTYDSLKTLHDMGIISKSTEKGVLVFHAEDPDRLLTFLDSKKEHLAAVLPELKKLYRQAPAEEDVFVYKGRPGIKAVLEDVIKYDRCAEMGNLSKLRAAIPNFFHRYQMMKREKRMKCRILLPLSAKGKGLVRGTYGNTKISSLLLPPTVTIVYSNKVACLHFGEDLFGTITKSKRTHDEYLEYFNSVWNSTD